MEYTSQFEAPSMEFDTELIGLQYELSAWLSQETGQWIQVNSDLTESTLQIEPVPPYGTRGPFWPAIKQWCREHKFQLQCWDQELGRVFAGRIK